MSTASDFEPALLQTPDGVVVRVYVQPKARREQLVGMHADRLKLAVTEPPDKGKATAAVVAFLATLMHVAPSQAEVIRGEISRQKDILLRGMVVSDVAKRILDAVSTR